MVLRTRRGAILWLIGVRLDVVEGVRMCHSMRLSWARHSSVVILAFHRSSFRNQTREHNAVEAPAVRAVKCVEISLCELGIVNVL